MYRVYLLKVNRETVGIAVSKGAKVARFFNLGIEKEVPLLTGSTTICSIRVCSSPIPATIGSASST
jgi:hypothetical protein